MPRKGAFARCVESVSERGGVSDPRAVCASSIARKRGRTRGRVNKRNLFGSSVTYSPTANKKAFSAGKTSGDTGLFGKWYKKSGYEAKGYDKPPLEREYERGVNAGIDEISERRAKKAEAAVKKAARYVEAGDVGKLESLVKGGMTLRQAADSLGIKLNPKPSKAEKTLLQTAGRLALLGGGGIPAVLLAGNRGRKKNPGTDAADAAYREFHGRDAEEIVTFTSQRHYPKHTAAIGDLIELTIRAPKERGLQDRYVTLSEFGEAWLTRHPRMKQLYAEGGDQSVDLGSFGLDSRDPHETEYLGELVRCVYSTRKDHLGKDGGIADYHHRFGKNELTLDKTELIKVGYHVPDRQLVFVGGGYEIPAEGIDG